MNDATTLIRKKFQGVLMLFQ